MSTPNFGATQDLTQEEQVLHHYAAMVKGDLEAYRMSASRHEQRWKIAFEERLVFLDPCALLI